MIKIACFLNTGDCILTVKNLCENRIHRLIKVDLVGQFSITLHFLIALYPTLHKKCQLTLLLPF